jgi:hypothetical protein
MHIPEMFCDVPQAGIFCRTSGMNHFAIAEPAVGTTLLPMRGSWSVCPSGVAIERPASPMGQVGRVAATMQEVIDGCGFDAPPMGEDEPMLVARALLIILYIIARFGEKG